MNNKITFKKATYTNKDIIFSWLSESHIQEFWDNTDEHKNDILNFMDGRKEPSNYCDGKMVYWIASCDNEPYSMLMTEKLDPTTPINQEKLDNLSKTGHTYGLDYMIGNPKYLGKGYGAKTLIEFMDFLRNAIDEKADTFLIDPASDNPRAKRVYEKASFKHIADFIMEGDCSGAGKPHHLLAKKFDPNLYSQSEDTPSKKSRCFGNKPGQEFYADYHDNQWGIPVSDDNLLFEMLILEGAQAGLSWETILKKRDGYRNAFHQFDVHKVANMTDTELEKLRQNENIICNRLKIYSAKKNANIFIDIQKEFGSFAKYLWSYVDNKPIINHWQSLKEIPATSAISDAISKDLKKRGMSFVGPIIIYAYMQAVGLVNDHIKSCWCYGRAASSGL